jgi:hypothetical protein
MVVEEAIRQVTGNSSPEKTDCYGGDAGGVAWIGSGNYYLNALSSTQQNTEHVQFLFLSDRHKKWRKYISLYVALLYSPL